VVAEAAYQGEKETVGRQEARRPGEGPKNRVKQRRQRAWHLGDRFPVRALSPRGYSPTGRQRKPLL